MTDKFLLVSLEESKAKQLAQVISNDLCRKMLDYLATKQTATETEIANALGIPLSTAHYNLKQLMQANIIKADEYHYSAKGREVNHYSLANKYIIIAPKATATESLASKLKKILPVLAITAAAGAAIQAFSWFKGSAQAYSVITKIEQVPSALETPPEVAKQLTDEATRQVQSAASSQVIQEGVTKIQNIAQEGISSSAEALNESMVQTVVQETTQQVITTTQTIAEPNIALWFLIGAVFAIAIYAFFDYVRKR